MSASGVRSIRVFLVTEHPALRQSLELLLAEEDMVICGWAQRLDAALAAMPADADVAIVGLPRGVEDSLGLVGQLAHLPGAPPELLLAADDDASAIRRALAAGARGYVTNREAPARLIEAIRDIVGGPFRSTAEPSDPEMRSNGAPHGDGPPTEGVLQNQEERS